MSLIPIVTHGFLFFVQGVWWIAAFIFRGSFVVFKVLSRTLVLLALLLGPQRSGFSMLGSRPECAFLQESGRGPGSPGGPTSWVTGFSQGSRNRCSLLLPLKSLKMGKAEPCLTQEHPPPASLRSAALPPAADPPRRAASASLLCRGSLPPSHPFWSVSMFSFPTDFHP